MINSYLARQPIFDIDEELIGYELLYRDDNGGPRVAEGDKATTEVLINSYIEIGLAKLVGNHQSFINVTRNIIINHDQLPPPNNHQLVLEVLEDVEADEEVVAAVKAMREKGYLIALDDFDYEQKHRGLLPLADIIKIDVLEHNPVALEKLVASLQLFPVKLLAEKVETPRQFEHCRGLGFDYYQGNFLSKPKIMRGRSLSANQHHVLQLLGELQKEEVEAKDLEKIVEQDVALSYKLLCYINSAAFSLRNKIESIRHALVCLGRDEIRKWASMIALISSEGKSGELIRIALVRAKLCELLTEDSGRGNHGAAFIVGLFSSLDALLDAPLSEVIETLPLAPDIKDALLYGKGLYGDVLRYTLAYEQGHWQAIDDSGISEAVAASCYLFAVEWADETTVQLSESAA